MTDVVLSCAQLPCRSGRFLPGVLQVGVDDSSLELQMKLDKEYARLDEDGNYLVNSSSDATLVARCWSKNITLPSIRKRTGTHDRRRRPLRLQRLTPLPLSHIISPLHATTTALFSIHHYTIICSSLYILLYHTSLLRPMDPAAYLFITVALRHPRVLVLGLLVAHKSIEIIIIKKKKTKNVAKFLGSSLHVSAFGKWRCSSSKGECALPCWCQMIFGHLPLCRTPMRAPQSDPG
jgi:hypothetical protein